MLVIYVVSIMLWKYISPKALFKKTCVTHIYLTQKSHFLSFDYPSSSGFFHFITATMAHITLSLSNPFLQTNTPPPSLSMKKVSTFHSPPTPSIFPIFPRLTSLLFIIFAGVHISFPYSTTLHLQEKRHPPGILR